MTLPMMIPGLAVTTTRHWNRLRRMERVRHLDSYFIHQRSLTTGMRLMMMTVRCLHRLQSPHMLQMRSPWSRFHLQISNTNKIILSISWRRPSLAVLTILGSVSNIQPLRLGRANTATT